MSAWRHLFRRPRLFDDTAFAFGAALAWGAMGALLGLFAEPPRPLPGASSFTRVLLQLGTGFGYGWWGGLIWSFVFALRSRTPLPSPTRRQLSIATGSAIAVFVAGFAGAGALRAGPGVAVLAAVVAATVTASIVIAAVRTRVGP